MKKYKDIMFLFLFVFGMFQMSIAQDRDAIIATLHQDNKYYSAVVVETDFETTIEKLRAQDISA